MTNFNNPFWLTIFYIIPGVSLLAALVTGLKGEYTMFVFLGMAFPAAAWLGRLLGYCLNDVEPKSEEVVS